MKERSGFVRRLIVVAVVALALVTATGTLVRPAQAAAGTSVTVRGIFVIASLSNVCHMVAGGSYKCVLTVSGAFHGGIEGSFLWVSKGIWTPDKPFSTVTAQGTIDCDPCTVAGLSGTITFSTVWTQSQRGDIVGTLTVTSASGQLAGLAGAGSWSTTAYSMAQNYIAALTLPA